MKGHLTFLKKYAKKYEVIDAVELGIDAIDASVNDLSNHIVLRSTIMHMDFRTREDIRLI